MISSNCTKCLSLTNLLGFCSCAVPECFVRGVQSDNIFDEGREDPQIPLKVAHHWPPEREPFAGRQMVAKTMSTGLVAV